MKRWEEILLVAGFTSLVAIGGAMSGVSLKGIAISAGATCIAFVLAVLGRRGLEWWYYQETKYRPPQKQRRHVPSNVPQRRDGYIPDTRNDPPPRRKGYSIRGAGNAPPRRRGRGYRH